MTTSLKAARDQQADEWVIKARTMSADQNGFDDAFITGWNACLKELERRIKLDPDKLAQNYLQCRWPNDPYWFRTVNDCERVTLKIYRSGAEWQFEQTLKVLRDQPEEEKP